MVQELFNILIASLLYLKMPPATKPGHESRISGQGAGNLIPARAGAAGA